MEGGKEWGGGGEEVRRRGWKEGKGGGEKRGEGEGEGKVGRGDKILKETTRVI